MKCRGEDNQDKCGDSPFIKDCYQGIQHQHGSHVPGVQMLVHNE